MIVDDEAPARSELRFLLEQTGKIGTITGASSVRSAIEMLMESRVDVVFLDISMPGASGLQLAEALHKLKNPPAIVFVTAYSDHAVEAFDVDAVDYLMKPVEEARLDRAIEKVMQRAKPVTDSKVTIERIPVEKGGRKVLIPVDDIRFIMAKDDYSCIYTVDDRFLSTTSRSMMLIIAHPPPKVNAPIFANVMNNCFNMLIVVRQPLCRDLRDGHLRRGSF